MTIFPIHILELLTLVLVLVFIYRISKELTLETTESASRDISPLLVSSAPLDSDQEQTLNTVENKLFHTQDASLIENHYSEKIIPKNIESHSVETSPSQNQALLKNYIGDFF